MTKIIDIYNKKKQKDSHKIYMFKSGIFYYFICGDAKYISEKYNFKVTSFGNTIKCGFPVKSIEKYLYIFQNENVEFVNEDNNVNNKVIEIIENLDMNNLSPQDAYLTLINLKELINEK